MTRQPSRRRRSFPLFSVTLFTIVGFGVFTASVVRDNPIEDFRDALAWLRGFDPMSAAAQPPAARRGTVVVAALQAQRPIDGDAVLKAAAENSAAEPRANQGVTGDKPEQSVKPEATQPNQAPEQKRESAGAANVNVVVTSDILALARRPADGASEARLAPSIDGARAVGDWSAAQEPAEPLSETDRLIARASGLLKLGDIGAARWLLSFAHEMGSARAGFMLAETYDPRILATWKVMGTRPDAAKARELYAKAYGGGIGEAKARLDGLAEQTAAPALQR
jgi:hypothetical protein